MGQGLAGLLFTKTRVKRRWPVNRFYPYYKVLNTILGLPASKFNVSPFLDKFPEASPGHIFRFSLLRYFNDLMDLFQPDLDDPVSPSQASPDLVQTIMEESSDGAIQVKCVNYHLMH